nr:hypothetical protein [Tanacetum cinerariifolium]
MDSGLAVLVFNQGDDPISCLNKAMAFITDVASSRFLLTNNQLITSSNLRNQGTIQDNRVTVQQVQGRQGQSYAGEGMARQCTQPKRPRNAAWFKEKAMLAEAQESGQILDEEQLAFLAVLMANLSNYGSDVISEAAVQDNNLYAQQDSMILSVIEQMILPNSDRTQRSRKNDIHLSLLDFCLPTNVIWIMQRTIYFSRIHDGNFHDIVEDFMEVFMDDFSVFGQKIYRVGIEVDRARIDVIAKLPYPPNVKGVRSFLGHAGFYQRKLTTAPIIISPDWNVPFELMYDASDFTIRAVLGHRIDEKFKPIYYASKTLNNAQEHYTTTEKELLAVVFSFDKFRPYLILSNTIVYTDHSELKAENLVADHMSRLENPNLGTFTEEEIADKFLDEHLMILKTKLNEDEPWGHHSASITGRKVYELGFFWPRIFKDAKDNVMRCDACQRYGNISSRSEMPQNNVQ